MAHIVTCMAGSDGEHGSLRSNISTSPHPSTDSLTSLSSSVSSVEEKKPFSWRMFQPESRKYQLFPKGDIKQTTGKKLDPEEAQAAALGQPAEDAENADKVNDLRVRIKEHNLNRRRKVSVPELGPMTTVHEMPMDSPTIPGRPAVHERSISTPVNSSWPFPQPYEFKPSTLSRQESASAATSPVSKPTVKRKTSNRNLPKQPPRSPKSLAPLTIPNQGGTLPRLARQLSLSRLRYGNSHPEPSSLPSSLPPRTDSRQNRKQSAPYTPLSANTNPVSAATSSTSAAPASAPADSRNSPRPWEKSGSTTPVTTPVTTPKHSKPDPTTTLKADVELPVQNAAATTQAAAPQATTPHKRNKSESGGIMDRGRPRKQSDGTPVGAGLRRAASKKTKNSEQRRAFEELPQGWKPKEAANELDQAEASYLHKQALGQVLRFEVLKKADVEILSKELRHLDERTEYLRRTLVSLRAGRRNLHSRICQYLRSPRGAAFSYDSMLKQEEALAELDTSIDDWVNKLEQADNRRTRVRQKLLEHVAAAATMGLTADVTGAMGPLQQSMGGQARNGVSDISTPPRSPAKNEKFFPVPSPTSSPQRVVARVPSVIPEAPFEDAAGSDPSTAQTEDPSSGPSTARTEDPDSETESRRMESIRIYADSDVFYADKDVYALLADVENEFTKLGGQETPSSPALTLASPTLPVNEDKDLHRSRSYEKLHGTDKAATAATTATTTTTTTVPIITETLDKSKSRPVSPILKDRPIQDSPTGGEFFLTAAVFKPTA